MTACAAGVTDEPDDEIGVRDVRTAVVSWNFEAASADCNGWSTSAATSIRATPSHSGTYACKLCADGSSEAMKLTHPLTGLTPGRYRVSAWLRRRSPGDDDVAAHVKLDQAPTRAGEQDSITLKKDWYLLGDGLDVTAATAASPAAVTIVAHTGGARICILVDDVTVEYVAGADAR